MPIDTIKRAEVATRREVEEVLFELGLTIQDVATALDIPRKAIDYDVRHSLRPRGVTVPQGPLTAQDRERAFGKALMKLAELTDQMWRINLLRCSDSSEVNVLIVSCLKRFLNLRELRAIATGVAGMIDHLSNPGCADPRYQGYQNLIAAIFGGLVIQHDGRILLEDYLHELKVTEKTGESVELPGRDNFAALLSAWAAQRDHEHFHLALTDDGIAIIEEALKTLPDDQQKVLRLRFGLGWDDPSLKPDKKEMTLEAIGKLFCITREAVRVKEAKALRSLRRMEFGKLRFLAGSQDDAISWALKQVLSSPSFTDEKSTFFVMADSCHV